ncbi:MAG: hypothetical protein JWN04_5395 [Myxococcaceae bacterium]|nr:hypothetical protein [Myxococcaceae bacterium]
MGKIGTLRFAAGLVERYRDETQCLLWHENVQLILSRTAPTLPFMKRIVLDLEVLYRQQGSRTGALLIIRDDVRPPSEEVRRYIAEELSRSSMAAAAQVVMGTGFAGAAMRSILTLIQTISSAPYPMKVFSEPGAGAMWLAQELRVRVGHAPAAAELARLAREAYRHFLLDDIPSSIR